MKTQAFAALFIASLSTSVFALPSDSQPVLGESKDGAYIQVIEPVAAEGSFMVLDRVAEGGSDRTGANRIAEGGSDRTGANRIAESGSDRTNGFRVAEGGSDRTNAIRVAEGGSDRLPQAQHIS
ncbi:phage infection protein [Pseudomonas sp. JS3066]|uniref:phage infection protein n=1 Tax=unclassified Pseudomonas TaxID=196821 RepID=UPI000EA931F7|nr:MULTISPECIES: phage infection protein [unclassified Pseudomonas]AYF89241.1 phage infection protein [Pseudomonas sp. DY-1]MDH4655752.1 phage infection protein [Pseudomonas sp. BN606]MRK21643.1 phage infection protein [Pseudomonas sp. JG-B]WVK93213.1 phage infection protein [Pseudomonas sp. JS3066]